MDWFELLENDDTSNRYHPPTLSFKEEDITVENMENYERRMSEILAELRAMETA